MSVTATIAASVAKTTYDILPEATRTAAKRSILDTIGIMIPSAHVDETCHRLARQVVAEAGGTGSSSLVGLGTKAIAVMAGFLNGCFVQALDYGDTIDATGHHPSGQCLPAALALAQAYGAPGCDLITAMAVAQDIGTRLSTARGASAGADSRWFPPTLFGPFSATLAAGKILGLDEARFINLLGLALHRSHGQLGPVTAAESEVRAIRYGLVAQDGVMCAMMAQQGVQAYHHGVEGLYDIYFEGDYDAHALVSGLGETFRGAEASIKPWPCCRSTHGHVNGIRALVEQHAITPDMIDSIILDTSAFGLRQLGEPEDEKRRPKKSIQSKNSLQFVSAVAALKVPVISDFLEESLSDPTVLALADRVTVRLNPECGMILPVITEIKLKDGRRLSYRSDAMIGTPARPMSDDLLVAKFKDCLGYATRPIEASQADRLIEMLQNLEKLRTLDELGNLLP